MTSKHCPAKSICRHVGSCQDCAHSRQYERMAHKISNQHAEIKRFRRELAQARQALMDCPGGKEATP